MHEAQSDKQGATASNPEKIKTIRDILPSGLEPIHIIHRHGMTEEESLLVEAALMDAYPGALDNLVDGHGAKDFGAAHVNQLVDAYKSEPMDFADYKVLLIKINRTAGNKSIYECVRHAWPIKMERAKKAEYVLAVDKGICRGVFKPNRWMVATKVNFPALTEDLLKRCGFEGVEAPANIVKHFINKRLPDGFIKKGKAFPCEYVNI